MAVRLNLSRKYSEQYGEELARKASRGDGTTKFKIADWRGKQRVEMRLNLTSASRFGSTYGSAENDLWSGILKFCGHKHIKFHSTSTITPRTRQYNDSISGTE